MTNNEESISIACEAFPFWAENIRELNNKLEAIIPGYQISRIKEKFLGLRYHIYLPEGIDNNDIDRAYDLISQYERACHL